MSKKWIFMVCLMGAFLCTALAGCKSTPKAIQENGIDRAQNKVESALAGENSVPEPTGTDALKTTTAASVSVQSSGGSQKANPTKPEAGKTNATTTATIKTDISSVELNTATKQIVESTPAHFKKSIDKSGKNMIIDASVVMPKAMKNLHVYEAEYSSLNDSDVDRLKKVLFSTYASNAKSKSGEWVCQVDGGEASLRIFGKTLFGFNITENTNGNKYLGGGTGTHAPGCKTSLQDAVKTAESFLDSFYDPEYRITSKEIRKQFSYSGSYSKMGTYRIEYAQTVDSVPISSDYEGSNDFTTGGYFVIDDRGIRMASAMALNVKEKQELSKILTLEQAVGVLEKKLNTIRISKYTPVFEISFEYFLTADNEVVPCWRFMVDQTEVLRKKLDQNKYWSNDFVVIAHTGQILHVPDRYPAMLNEDGSITGGNPNK